MESIENIEEPVPEPLPEEPPRRRALAHAAYIAPLILLLLLAAAPLIRGTETLYLRDVLNTHFEMKQAQAQAMRAGYFPILDPYRAGGQPLAGNPNAVPFYPDNLLYLAGSTFWALNAHFWLHLLLAPFAFAWMARAWGLRREAAWAAAACWTLSGFYLSHLSFYNLIAGVTLAPALIAACLRFAQGNRRIAPVIAVLWGLLLLGGDPLMALLGGLLAAAALLPYLRDVLRRREPWTGLALLAVCVGVGTLLALPQLEEFRRILPMSFRGHRGYTAEAATVASWDPRQAAEWLVPFVFGRPDLLAKGSFWGSRFFTGVPPYYLSLYPGLLSLALLVASGRPRGRAAWWAWGCVAAGLFLSLGRFNPIAEWLFSLPGRGSLRYPVKFWLPVAVGAALLCGVGFERLFFAEEDERGIRDGARHRFRLALLVLVLVLGGLWAFLTFNPGPAESWIAGLGTASRGRAFVVNERLRWGGLCFLSVGIVGGLTLLARIGWRRPVLGGALLLAFHAAVQLLLLRPLYPSDAIVPYRMPSPALDSVPKGVPVVHADFNYLFGPSTLKQGDFPSSGAHWMERRAFYELYPFTGAMRGRRFELNSSAEGLDSFLARMAEGAVKGSKDDDAKRLRLLAAWGVQRLLMNHPLDPPQPRARLIREIPSFGQTLYIYEIVYPAPLAFFPRRIFSAPHLNAAYQTLSGPGFDARTDGVVPGEGAPWSRTGGTVRQLQDGPEAMDFEVTAGRDGGLLVIQRAHLSLWEAEIDGRPAQTVPVNLYRLGVEIPGGRHQVRFRIDRRPLAQSFWAVALALALLPALAWWGGRSRRASPSPGEGDSGGPGEGAGGVRALELRYPPLMKKIRKILIANRGEIACRVIRACREMGIRSAVIYSEPDRLGLPVLLADEAYSIGPAPSRESYLRAEAIVELAVEIGADAIHPGYGFLSERAGFARLCREAGVTFIGPSPEAIDAMGSKVESRRLMIDAGVPVVPGGRDPLPELEAAQAAAEAIGWPVMLKAAAGGGGKGMRKIDSAAEFASSYRAARSEAGASFGDDSVYLEKYIVEPRHVEIQVLGDLHGRVVSLGERECSLQRRHQKIVEEAPSPVVDADLRRRMGEAAVRAASAVGYSNAGTCEFLLARNGEFYFLEMNTRLQVEHPVTELVTGIDLVHWQIRIAEGEPLGPEFEDVQPRGHAVEVRLYAEDPFQRFAPSPGRITLLRWPEGPGIRNDAGVYEGSEVSIHYDPMLAKLIVWAADRPRALDRLRRALSELRIEGIRTTAPLFQALLADPDFLSGNMDIAMLDRKLAEGQIQPPSTPEEMADLPLIAAAIEHYDRANRTAAGSSGAGLRSRWAAAARSEALRRG